jgi:hypothetical protein
MKPGSFVHISFQFCFLYFVIQITPCPMELATIFQISIRLLSLARFLVTSRGDAHPSWSQMLTPKMKPSFRPSFGWIS